MTKQSQVYNLNTESNEISFREFILKIGTWWQYLLSKWAIIILFGILGGALGFYYAYSKKPIYTASTTFVLEDEKGGGLGNLASLASVAGIDIGDTGGGLFQSENLPELYKSRNMIEKTLLSPSESNPRKILIDQYIQFNNLKEKWRKKPELLAVKFNTQVNNRLRDSLISVIVSDINKNYLAVGKPDKKLSIIKVDVKTSDELFSKEFNDRLVRNVNNFYLQTKTKKSLNNVTILQHKVDSVRNVMNGAIYTAAAVSDATPNLNPTRQTQRIAPIQRSQFTAESNKAILSTLVQNLELTKMALLKETPLIQLVDRPVYPLIKSSYNKILFSCLFSFITVIITSLFLVFGKLYKVEIKSDDYK